MKRILIIAISLLLVALGRAETWNPETLPMVHLQDSTRWTCNPDGILFPSTVETLDSICTALEHAKGVQCVVVCVEHIEGDDPYVFNKDLFEKYGIGQSGADNGLIITLATLDRSYFISPGRGLEGTLPDAICNRIENAIMVPFLKESDWNSALTGTLLAISQYIQGDDTLLKQAEDKTDSSGLGLLLAVVLGIGGLIGGASYSDYRARNRKCPHCGAKHTLRMTSEKITEARLWTTCRLRQAARPRALPSGIAADAAAAEDSVEVPSAAGAMAAAAQEDDSDRNNHIKQSNTNIMSSTTKVLIGIAGVIVVLGVAIFGWYFSTKNTLVEKEEIVKERVGNMQSQYQRRMDLISKAVKTAIAESKHERGTFTDVTEARARATQITIDPNNLTEESLRRFQEAQGELSQALGRLMVADENYPELKASQAWQEIRAQLEGTENRINKARDDYNEAVKDYNLKVRQFPSSIVAGWAGFEVKPMFEADAEAQHAPDFDIPEDI